MKALRDFRLIPIVLLGIGSLVVLKVAGLMIDGGYILNEPRAPQKRSWAQENLNFPSGNSDPDITGSVEAKPKEGDALPKGVSLTRPAEAPAATPATLQTSDSERAVLERLQARRQDIESRGREMDIRESLLKAAEKRIESRTEELKGVEARITAANQQKDDIEAARFKSIVTMYENMKPKDAAKIFDRLDSSVLLDVASRMKPQKMSDVLAQMNPDVAERLTVELARRSGSDKTVAASDLPKIEGKTEQKN
jgi:flagellar motility protein MotE (MotC chaperone)